MLGLALTFGPTAFALAQYEQAIPFALAMFVVIGIPLAIEWMLTTVQTLTRKRNPEGWRGVFKMVAPDTRNAPGRLGAQPTEMEQNNGQPRDSEFAVLNRISIAGLVIGVVAFLVSVAGFFITRNLIFVFTGVGFVIAAQLTWIACALIMMWKMGREIFTLRRLAKLGKHGEKDGSASSP